MPTLNDPSRQPAPNSHWCVGCSPENCHGCPPEPASKPFLYHYHGMTQPSAGVVQHFDGTVVCESLLASTGLFAEVRLEIARIAGLADTPEKMNLCSLTLLNPPH